MTTGRTRTVMLASAALVAAVVLLFLIASLNARADRREAADERFANEAAITASVIESVFSSGVAMQAQQYAQEIGGAESQAAALDALAERSQLAYAVLLGPRGDRLAATASLDAGAAAALAERPRHVRAVLEGAPFQISGIVSAGNAEYVSAFDTPAGRRILVQGFPVQLISGLVGGTLAQLPNAEQERAFVVDSRGLVIASAEPGIDLARSAPKVGEDQADTMAAVGSTDWRVVLSTQRADLYKGTANRVQWLVLIALAAVGAFALFLLARGMRTRDQLAAAYADLERSNADLARTNTELQRSNGELEQFASAASHDLQEPLRKVQAFGDQLERRHAAHLDEEARDYLRRMRDASARMSVLIDDLLRFSRVTTHAKPHVGVDLDRVARDVVSDLETRIWETGGRVELSDLPTVQADPTQMRQLLQNLIGNGLKFHRDGVPPVVRVSSDGVPRDGMVAVEFADNGIGFEAEYGERIFRVFERLHPRDVYAGTGIGLALCRKIAERHGGGVTAESRPGEGSTFTVRLPHPRGH